MVNQELKASAKQDNHENINTLKASAEKYKKTGFFYLTQEQMNKADEIFEAETGVPRYVTLILFGYRHDTSQRDRRQLPPCLLVIAFVPFKQQNLFKFPHIFSVPFTKEKVPSCPCLNTSSDIYARTLDLAFHSILFLRPTCTIWH